MEREGAENKGYRPTLRQPPKSELILRARLISRAIFFGQRANDGIRSLRSLPRKQRAVRGRATLKNRRILEGPRLGNELPFRMRGDHAVRRSKICRIVRPESDAALRSDAVRESREKIRLHRHEKIIAREKRVLRRRLQVRRTVADDDVVVLDHFLELAREDALASGSRRRRLSRIKAPTLVIHGSADRLVAPSGGRATARAIPGANLLMVGGMGHDLPREAWPLLIDAIAGNAARAERGVSPAAAVAA